MKDKVVLLSGGGGGTGKHASRMFAEEGVKVVIADIDEDAGQKAVDLAKQAGGQAAFVKCDVRCEKDVAAAVELVLDKYGRLDYAVNIVGSNDKFTGIAELTQENWDSVMNITLRSSFYAMKYEIPAMIKGGGGSIVNVGSSAGIVGVLAHGGYPAAKAGLVGMTKSAALDYAKQGIRVNSVCLGPMLSVGMQKYLDEDPHFGDQYLINIPLGKFINQEHVAAAYVFLCSQYAASITGAVIPIDGGWSV